MTHPWEQDPDAWRGDLHLPDWPEEAYLGAEYGLFKRDAERAA